MEYRQTSVAHVPNRNVIQVGQRRNKPRDKKIMENITEKHNARRLITGTEPMFSEHQEALPFSKTSKITNSSFIMVVCETFFENDLFKSLKISNIFIQQIMKYNQSMMKKFQTMFFFQMLNDDLNTDALCRKSESADMDFSETVCKGQRKKSVKQT